MGLFNIKYYASTFAGLVPAYFFVKQLSTKENLELFMYSFVTSSGFIAASMFGTCIVMDDPMKKIKSLFTRVPKNKIKLDFVIEENEKLKLDYDFTTGSYLVSINFDDNKSVLYSMSVYGEDSDKNIHVKMHGKRENPFFFDTDRDKIVMNCDHFTFGSMRIIRL